MSAPNLKLVQKPSAEQFEALDILATTGDLDYLIHNAGLLCGLPNRELNHLFKMVGGRLGIDRFRFNEILGIAREVQQPTEVDGLPVVQTNNVLLGAATAAVLRAMEAANEPPSVFRRGNSLVTVQQDETGLVLITRFDPLLLRSRIARVAAFVMYSKNGNSTLCAPPMDIVNDVLKCDEGPSRS